MALDLADERRSAHRLVQPELWLCIGGFGGERALSALEAELAASNSHTLGRRAAAYALARAGRSERLSELIPGEENPEVRASMEDALSGTTNSTVFRALRPERS